MNNVLDLFDAGCIPVDNNENYVFVVSLIDFDYPRCFVAKKEDELFVFMECEADTEHLCWTVSKTTPLKLKMVNDGKAIVQSLFSDVLFEVYYRFSSSHAFVKDANPNHEIKGSFFSTNFGDMDELFDVHCLQKAAKSNRENSVSLVFENDKSGSTSLILKAISYLKNLFKSLNNPFDIMNTNLSVQQGSTVITFTAKSDLPKDVNLTPDMAPVATDSFVELGNVLSAEDPNVLLSYSKKTKQFLNKYKGIVDSLSKENELKPKIVLAVSDFNSAKSYSMSEDSAQTRKKVIREATDLVKQKIQIAEKETITKGVLSGINSKKKGFFVFKSNDGNEYEGIVDVALNDKMGSFVVKGAIYKATIKELHSNTNGEDGKSSYVLKDLEFVEKIDRHLQMDLFDEK